MTVKPVAAGMRGASGCDLCRYGMWRAGVRRGTTPGVVGVGLCSGTGTNKEGGAQIRPSFRGAVDFPKLLPKIVPKWEDPRVQGDGERCTKNTCPPA